MSAIDCYECGCGFSGEYDVFRVHVGWARIRRALFGWWPWRKKPSYKENVTATFIADLWSSETVKAMQFTAMLSRGIDASLSVGDTINFPRLEKEETDDER